MTRTRNCLVGCTLIFLVLMSSMALAAPIPPEVARTAAGTFLSSQSPVAAKPVMTAPSDLRDADGNLLGYVVTTTSGGYVVTAADTDIPPILAYSDVGTFPLSSDSDNPAWHLVAGLVADWKENLELAVPEASAAKVAHQGEWDRYLSGVVPSRKPSEEQTVWGPLLETQWGQLDPFNKFLPIDPNTGERCKIGCAPLAFAQILNYWKFPPSITLTEKDAYTSLQYGGQGLDNTDIISSFEIPGDAEILDFASFEELNAMLADITYSGDEDETAAFCFANVILAKTKLSSWASAGSPWLFDYGFNASKLISGWPAPYEACVDNMQKGLPAYLNINGYYTSGPNDGRAVGHAAALDGYNAGSGMFHVNMGHAGDGDGWFLFPDMDAVWGYFDHINNVKVNLVREYGTLSGRITDDKTGEGISSVEIMVLPTGIPFSTNADGFYEINLPPGSYSLEAVRTFYQDTYHPAFDIAVDGQVTADMTMEYDSPEIAHYQFEESMVDIIGNHDLSINSNYIRWIDGPMGRAVELHNPEEEQTYIRLSVSHNDFIYRDNSEMTIETWVKIPHTSMNVPLIDNDLYSLSVRNGHILLWLIEENPSRVMPDNRWRTLEAPVDIKPEVWYHVAGVWGDQEYMKIFINGRLVAEQPAGNIKGVPPGTNYKGSTLKVGSIYFPDDVLALDEVRVTGTALSPEDFGGYPFDLLDRGTLTGAITDRATGAPIHGAIITCEPEGVSTASNVDGSFRVSVAAGSGCALTVNAPAYHATNVDNVTVTAGSEYPQNISLDPRPDNPTVAWYRFEGNGEDSSGSGNDLSIVNYTTAYEWFKETEWVNGQSGSALNVSRYDKYHYSIAGDGWGCAYPGIGDWTVETWVKLPSENRFTEIVYHPGFFIGYHGSQYTGPGTLPYYHMVFTFNGQMITAPYNNADTWVHVAGVYRYLDRLELYINGELVAEEAAQGIPQVYPFAPLDIVSSNDTFYVIDDLRITAAALDPSEFLYNTTAVEHDAEPIVFSLGANFPNPFNPTTTIPFTLAGEEFTTLTIYNLAGQRVRELVAGNMRTGAHTVVWDGRNDAGAHVASGVYLSRLVAGEMVMVRRMVLVK
jgi:hypothetical protein